MGLIGLAALILLALLCLLGLVITPLGLPGTFVILAAALLYNLIHWAMAISLWVLLLLSCLAVLGEILEYGLSVRMASRRGASNAAIAGALIGGLVGAIVGIPVPVIGSIIGLFLGVFIGAFLLELIFKKDAHRAFRAAVGAFYGRAGAILVKTMIGLAMTILIAAAVF